MNAFKNTCRLGRPDSRKCYGKLEKAFKLYIYSPKKKVYMHLTNVGFLINALQ